jgi:anionic cell wall polymer biosynthesis LytR-Cps2A-Psr (LCP) family protein
MRYDLGPKRKYYTETANKTRSEGKVKLAVVAVVLLFVVGLFVYFKTDITSLFDPVSFVANVAASDLKTTDGRTNILVLGSDQRSKDSRLGQLTDTILVASIGKIDKDVVLISVPRDLWVQTDCGYSKINAVYGGFVDTDCGGIEELKTVLHRVLGIEVHYYGLMTFDLFRESVDTLGGVDINVEKSFTDYQYPIEGKENDTCGRSQEEIDKLSSVAEYLAFPCRYETVEFTEGQQNMDGDIALKYARSRKGNNNEGTDFARSKRQQKMITAIKNKALSVKTILNPLKLKELYDIYSNSVDTDIQFSTLSSFYEMTTQIQFDKVISIVLDDRSTANEGGLLYSPEDTSLYGGQYVLVPRTGDYSQIHAFVQRYLFANK